MKISEIIIEGTKGSLRPEHKAALHTTTTFNDNNGAGFDYNFNRVGLALAMADGSGKKLDIDDRTWYHSDNVAVPYTELENRMLKQAFKSINSTVNSVVRDHKSKEQDDTHKISPVPVRKKNRRTK